MKTITSHICLKDEKKSFGNNRKNYKQGSTFKTIWKDSKANTKENLVDNPFTIVNYIIIKKHLNISLAID